MVLRFGHRAVFIKNSSEILMYGGMAYAVDQPISLNFTYNSSVVSEMWYFNLYHCINNCSNHGTCFYGWLSSHIPPFLHNDYCICGRVLYMLWRILWRRLLEHILSRHLLLLRHEHFPANMHFRMSGRLQPHRQRHLHPWYREAALLAHHIILLRVKRWGDYWRVYLKLFLTA